MYKDTVCVLAIVSVLTCKAFCQPQPGVEVGKEDVQSDDNKVEKRLQGKWHVVEARGSYGVVEEDEYGGKLIFNFDGDKLSSIQGGKTTDSRRFSIDASHTPMWIDAGKIKGILRLDKDTLTICWGLKRPRGFDLSKGNFFEERYVLKKVNSVAGPPN